MESFWILGSIAFALMLRCNEPWNDVDLCSKYRSRFLESMALFTALGTGTGAAVFGLLAVLGLQAFLLAVPSAYFGLKNLWWSPICFWLAFKIIKHAKEPIEADHSELKSNDFTPCLYDWLNYPALEP